MNGLEIILYTEKIKRYITINDNPTLVKKRCIIEKIQFEDLDKACNIWFLQQRSKGAPVSGPLLQEKALQLFPQLYLHHEVGTFKGSSGWLHKFCRRHGIRTVQLQGESLSANTSAIQPFKCDLFKIIETRGYTKDQIFNADETGLWWRMLPSRSLVSVDERNPKNFKQSKARVTILACANASGSCRLLLTFIHKSSKPRCFKHTNMESLPVHYFTQHKSWMDSKVFLEWFQRKFVAHVKQFCHEIGIECKILLLLDNAPAHPSADKLQSQDRTVTTMFLPANTTSLVQPMDQGIIESVKRRYKNFCVTSFLKKKHHNKRVNNKTCCLLGSTSME